VKRRGCSIVAQGRDKTIAIDHQIKKFAAGSVAHFLRRAIAPFFSLCYLVSCVPSHHLRTPLKQLNSSEAEKYFELVNHQSLSQADTYRALSKLTIYRGDEVTSLRLALVSGHDKKVRFELLPDIGAFSLHLICKESDTKIVEFNQDEKKYKIYDSEKDILYENFKLPLSLGDLVILAQGKIPRAIEQSFKNAKFYTVSQSQDEVYLTGKRFNLVLNLITGKITDLEILDKSSFSSKVIIQFIETPFAPATLKIHILSYDITIYINWKQFNFTKDIPEELFICHPESARGRLSL
jgi:hypothetical protein